MNTPRIEATAQRLERLKAKRAINTNLLLDYVDKHPGCRPKQIAADLGWSKGKLAIVYGRSRALFSFGLVCKNRPTDAMANSTALATKQSS